MEEEIVNKKAEESKKKKRTSLKSILGGDILATDFFRRQTKLLVLIMVFIIFYIHNRYASQQQQIEIDRLKKEYPDAACTLDYDHAWQLLVSVRLAAQCTDARVNIVVEDLFAKYPSVAALAAAEPEEIEAIVKPCGLGHSKARDISACMRMLRDKYDCKVPTTFEELLSLPGVGRKSANLIMGDVFGKPAIVTDTHCIRLSNRIGLVHDLWHIHM